MNVTLYDLCDMAASSLQRAKRRMIPSQERDAVIEVSREFDLLCKTLPPNSFSTPVSYFDGVTIFGHNCVMNPQLTGVSCFVRS
jgi:hypothetical protein